MNNLIQIIFVEGTQLYRRYPREDAREDVYVRLDCRSRTLWAGVAHRPMGIATLAIDVSIAEKHILQWEIPALRAEAANALLKKIAPHAQKVRDGYHVEWVGSDCMARYSVRATEAIGEIGRLCSVFDEKDCIRAYLAKDYLAHLGDRAAQRDALGIRLDATSREITLLAGCIWAEAVQENGVDVLDGLDDYLRELRDEAIEKLVEAVWQDVRDKGPRPRTRSFVKAFVACQLREGIPDAEGIAGALDTWEQNDNKEDK